MFTSNLTHALPDLQPVGWLGVVGTACLVIGYAVKALRSVARLMKKTGEFLDDWQGEPARPGVPARLGILVRLANVEDQLKTNGGTSLKDQTNRIERALNEHIMASGDHDQKESHA